MPDELDDEFSPPAEVHEDELSERKELLEKVLEEEKKEPEPTQHHHMPQEKPKMTVHEWFYTLKWRSNPFTFSISPNLFVGYKSQIERVLMALEERHKMVLILGPTGSGKTTFLRWLTDRLKSDVVFIGKPPMRPEEFVVIFKTRYRKPWYAFWEKEIRSVYELPDFLNRRLRSRHLVVMMDEGHEAGTEILEWIRVINDQVENMSVVVTGLPHFESQLRSNLETFMKRVTTKTELLSLTKEETEELIRRRIQAAGGTGDEFSHVYHSVYEYTGGFPREILRVCDALVNNAIMHGRTRIEFDIHEKKEEEQPKADTPLLGRMTPMQKEILEMLSTKSMTPGQIANALDLTKYKSRQHAVRSVNNVVKKLHEDGFVERKRDEKAFVYSLSPKISTLFVKR